MRGMLTPGVWTTATFTYRAIGNGGQTRSAPYIDLVGLNTPTEKVLPLGG